MPVLLPWEMKPTIVYKRGKCSAHLYLAIDNGGLCFRCTRARCSHFARISRYEHLGKPTQCPQCEKIWVIEDTPNINVGQKLYCSRSCLQDALINKLYEKAEESLPLKEQAKIERLSKPELKDALDWFDEPAPKGDLKTEAQKEELRLLIEKGRKREFPELTEEEEILVANDLRPEERTESKLLIGEVNKIEFPEE